MSKPEVESDLVLEDDEYQDNEEEAPVGSNTGEPLTNTANSKPIENAKKNRNRTIFLLPIGIVIASLTVLITILINVFWGFSPKTAESYNIREYCQPLGDNNLQCYFTSHYNDSSTDVQCNTTCTCSTNNNTICIDLPAMTPARLYIIFLIILDLIIIIWSIYWVLFPLSAKIVYLPVKDETVIIQ